MLLINDHTLKIQRHRQGTQQWSHFHMGSNAAFSPQSFKFVTVSQTGSKALCTNVRQFVILHTIKHNEMNSELSRYVSSDIPTVQTVKSLASNHTSWLFINTSSCYKCDICRLTQDEWEKTCVGGQLLNSLPLRQKSHYYRDWKKNSTREREVKFWGFTVCATVSCAVVAVGVCMSINTYLKQCSLGRSLSVDASLFIPWSPIQFSDRLETSRGKNKLSFTRAVCK